MEASTKGTQPYIELMGRRYDFLPVACSSLHLSSTLFVSSPECKYTFSVLPCDVSNWLLSSTGRPLFQTQDQQWRALSKGTPVSPSVAFSYISRSFRQTTPHVIGSLRLLAESFSPQEINKKGWGLYAEFRPIVDGWGKRSELKYATILDLRLKSAGKNPLEALELPVKFEEDWSLVETAVPLDDGPQEEIPEDYELVPPITSNADDKV